MLDRIMEAKRLHSYARMYLIQAMSVLVIQMVVLFMLVMGNIDIAKGLTTIALLFFVAGYINRQITRVITRIRFLLDE